jgi:hypothetical protein
MNADRQAFLDDIEADLTTTRSSRPVEVSSRRATAGNSSRLIRRIGIAGAVLAASASFSTLFTSTASASPAAASSVLSDCATPNPVPYSHFKSCGVGGFNHDYRSQYSAGPGGQRTCYVFWSTMLDLGCGTDPGRWKTVCA